MSRQALRRQRKAFLLRQIQQQRLDLAASRHDWLAATDAYDRGWSMLLSLRAWALVGSSVAAVWSIRHPRFLIRWSRRGFALWSAWRRVKRTVRQQNPRKSE